MNKKNKAKLAEWIRETCLLEVNNIKNEPKQIKTIDPELAKEFSKIGSNINQLAKGINTAVKYSNDLELKNTCEVIRDNLINIEDYMDEIRLFLLVDNI